MKIDGNNNENNSEIYKMFNMSFLKAREYLLGSIENGKRSIN